MSGLDVIQSNRIDVSAKSKIWDYTAATLRCDTPVIGGDAVNKDYVDASGVAIWGSITGTLTNQLDLQAALDLKLNITDFSATFDIDFALKDTDDLTEGSINLYDKVVTLTAGVNVTITGIYPDFTISSSGGGSVAWGTITGTLSNQLDLQVALDLKYDAADYDADFDARLATKDTGDLTEGVNLYYTQARFDSAFTAKSTSDLSEGSNLYYTEVRVSANADVSANTSARHDAVTLAGKDYLTLVGQVITANLIDLADDVSGILPIANGGTNSSTALNNDRVIVSSGGAIIESATITTTELGLLNGIVSVSTGAGDNDKFVTQGYVDDAITTEDFWDRAATLLTTHTSNDDIAIGGKIGIGFETAPTYALHIVGTDNNSTIGLMARYENTTTAPSFVLINARGTPGSPAATESGDNLGTYYLGGYDSTDIRVPAAIMAEATETWNATSWGAKLKIRVTPAGTTGMITAIEIEDDGECKFYDDIRLSDGKKIYGDTDANISIEAGDGGTNNSGGTLTLRAGSVGAGGANAGDVEILTGGSNWIAKYSQADFGGHFGYSQRNTQTRHYYNRDSQAGGDKDWYYEFRRSRGSYDSPTLVADNDYLGEINFRGYDGSNYIEGAYIRAEIDGTPGAADLPTSLIFATTADGDSSATPAMWIKSNQHIRIGGEPSEASLFGVSQDKSLYIRSTQPQDAFSVEVDDNGNLGPVIDLLHNSASPAVDDEVGRWRVLGKDSNGDYRIYAQMNIKIKNVTAGSTDAEFLFQVERNGNLEKVLSLNMDNSIEMIVSSFPFGTDDRTAYFQAKRITEGHGFDTYLKAADGVADVAPDYGGGDVYVNPGAGVGAGTPGDVKLGTIGGKIIIGTGDDTNLYRDSANVLKTDDSFITGANVIFNPSTTQDITAGGGITVTNGIMNVQGSGGDVNITANPQIVAGTNGQIVIIEGKNDSQKVTIENGDGLHLHGGSYVLGNHDSILFKYDTDNSEWEEISRNAPATEKSWAFRSRAGASGTTYAGGFYKHSGTANDFSAGPTFGTTNSSYAAHFFVVTGADTVDELTLTITGTSITDGGVRDASPHTENIVIPTSTSAGAYYETEIKWLGQITITVASGTAKICDFGFAKYWDNNNNDFRVLGLESTWLAGATDTAPNLILRHHKGTAGNTDWTYTGSGATPPSPIAVMATDHSTIEDNLINGENGAWKRDNLDVTINGSGSEGTIIEVVTSANKAFELGDFLLRIRPN